MLKSEKKVSWEIKTERSDLLGGLSPHEVIIVFICPKKKIETKFYLKFDLKISIRNYTNNYFSKGGRLLFHGNLFLNSK
jgi:hypothetical protein